MSNATATREQNVDFLAFLIEQHTAPASSCASSVAHHLDVDTRRRWARARQDRFDAAGLPRGLARVV